MELVELVELLDRQCPSDEAFFAALEPALAHRKIEPLVEYLAERLQLLRGEQSVVFLFSDGNLRQTTFEHRRVGNSELETLARR